MTKGGSTFVDTIKDKGASVSDLTEDAKKLMKLADEAGMSAEQLELVNTALTVLQTRIQSLVGTMTDAVKGLNKSDITPTHQEVHSDLTRGMVQLGNANATLKRMTGRVDGGGGGEGPGGIGGSQTMLSARYNMPYKYGYLAGGAIGRGVGGAISGGFAKMFPKAAAGDGMLAMAAMGAGGTLGSILAPALGAGAVVATAGYAAGRGEFKKQVPNRMILAARSGMSSDDIDYATGLGADLGYSGTETTGVMAGLAGLGKGSVSKSMTQSILYASRRSGLSPEVAMGMAGSIRESGTTGKDLEKVWKQIFTENTIKVDDPNLASIMQNISRLMASGVGQPGSAIGAANLFKSAYDSSGYGSAPSRAAGAASTMKAMGDQPFMHPVGIALASRISDASGANLTSQERIELGEVVGSLTAGGDAAIAQYEGRPGMQKAVGWIANENRGRQRVGGMLGEITGGSAFATKIMLGNMGGSKLTQIHHAIKSMNELNNEDKPGWFDEKMGGGTALKLASANARLMSNLGAAARPGVEMEANAMNAVSWALSVSTGLDDSKTGQALMSMANNEWGNATSGAAAKWIRDLSMYGGADSLDDTSGDYGIDGIMGKFKIEQNFVTRGNASGVYDHRREGTNLPKDYASIYPKGMSKKDINDFDAMMGVCKDPKTNGYAPSINEECKKQEEKLRENGNPLMIDEDAVRKNMNNTSYLMHQRDEMIVGLNEATGYIAIG